MARTLIHEFAVTIPAGTPQANPLVTPTTFAPNQVQRIVWRFPPGSLGVCGIQIGARAVQIIPANAGAFLVASGESSGYTVADLPNTGDWSVIGFNTGAFPHTVFVTFITHRLVRAPDLRLFIGDEGAIARMGES